MGKCKRTADAMLRDGFSPSQVRAAAEAVKQAAADAHRRHAVAAEEMAAAKEAGRLDDAARLRRLADEVCDPFREFVDLRGMGSRLSAVAAAMGKLERPAEQPSDKSDAAAKDEPGQTGNAVIEFESYAPPRIEEKPYCETTMMWPPEANTTTHHASIDWFTCPRKEARRYRVTVEELSEDPVPTEHEVA